MKPDPDNKMSPSASSIESDLEGDLTMGELPRQMPFLWQNFGNEQQRDRVDIKQQAVFDALRLGDTIADKWRKWQNENQRTATPELAYWVKKFESTKKEHRNHKGPVVGFLGVLGAGKTSLINALLGQEELLASSSDRAATAVVCEVVYNHESLGCRAEITYRTQQSLVDELDKMFADLKFKAELEASVERAEGNSDHNEPDLNGSDTESLDQVIADLQENLRATIDAVTEIWGVDEDDLRGMSTQELLETKPYGVKHLGTTRHIEGTDQEEFADDLTSYLKSSSDDDNESGLPPCPLIEKVTVYVKSPILRYGLRLRDLPGLCDTSEARSDVAKKNSKDLDIPVIVAPAIRATEESTAINLIKGQQKIQMQMNGNFNKGSLCIVLSKIDDIKSEAYLKQLKAAKSNKLIQSQLRRRKELDAALGRASSKKLKSTQQAAVSGANTEIEEDQREAVAIKDWLEHAAVFLRTRDITQRFQDRFRPHHRDTVLGSNTDSDADDEAVEVFGVSNKAYWMSMHPDGVKATGFPDEKHSGIPRLRQWLLEASFNAREKHLDAILNKLWGLLIDIQELAGLECGDTQEATESDTEELQRIHECFIKELTGLLKQSGADLSRIEPLRKQESAIIESQKQCAGIVERWAYKYPKKKNEPQKLHAGVQTCILRKKGEPYTTQQTSQRSKYEWLDDLAKPYYDIILGTWNRTFQEAPDACERRIMSLTEPAWQEYGASLSRRLLRWPGSTSDQDTQIQDAIEIGSGDMRVRVRGILDALKTQAGGILPLFRQEVQESMATVFKEALDIDGNGCKAKRDKLLREFFKLNSPTIFRKAAEKVETEFLKELGEHVRNLEELARPCVLQVVKRVQPIFGVRKAIGTPASRDATRKFLQANGHVLASWKFCWRKPSTQREDHVMRGDMSVPEPAGLVDAENEA